MATILRNKTHENFTVIPNQYLRDSSLSLQAMGLLTKLYQLPDGWDINIRSLSTQCKNGRDAVAKVLKELEDKGYIKRYQEKSTNGMFGNNIVELCGEGSIEPFTPCTENPSTDSSCAEKLPHINTIYTNTRNKEEEEEVRASEFKDLNEALLFAKSYVDLRLKNRDRYDFICDLLTIFFADLKTLKKSSIQAYCLKVLQQHDQPPVEVEVNNVTKSTKARSRSASRTETIIEYDNEPVVRTPEEEAFELERIKNLMKDLK